MLIDAYVRVSAVAGRSGASFISPTLQVERIQRWAALHGATIATVHEELDQSGARADRPMLQEALRRVEAGEIDGIVVARMDRFGRSLLHSLAAIERIDQAGGFFASVDDGLDLRQDTGRLVLRIMLSLAEWELDRIRSAWRDAKTKAVDRGMHPSAVVPFGYRRKPGRPLTPHRRYAPYLREVFQRRAAGERLSVIGRWLEQEQVPTSYGNPGWTYTTLSGLITNRVYLGEAFSGEAVNRSAHPALVNLVTWQRAQAPPRAAVRERRPSLLAGLVRCAGCCYVATGGQRGKWGVHYSCLVHHAAGPCQAPAGIFASQLEPLVVRAVEERARRRVTARTSAAVTRARDRLDGAERALAAYRDNANIANVIGPERFTEGLRARLAKVEGCVLTLGAAEDRHRGPEPLPGNWRELPIVEQRGIIGAWLDCVFLAKGRARPEDRVLICWKGEAPVDLPNPMRNHHGVKPFLVADLLGPARARSPYPAAFAQWPREQIEAELRVVTAGWNHLPSREQFHRLGHAELYSQVLVTGGPKHWAPVLGLPIVTPTPNRHRWTDEGIAEAVTAYLAGRTVMPRTRDFTATGDFNLWDAMSRHGGVDLWCARLGVTRSPVCPGGRPRRASASEVRSPTGATRSARWSDS